MKKRKMLCVIFLIAILLISLILFYFIPEITGNAISSENLKWSHLPVTYSIERCELRLENIKNAFNKISLSANRSVYFEEVEDNADIKISCSYLKNCYENKTKRKWFWIITSEAICSHESGTAKITKIKGNKILKAKINLVYTGKKDNCSETEIHEILHVFGYEHSDNNSSIMYPIKEEDSCNENIESEIINELIAKYK